MNGHECTTDLPERQRRARVSSTEHRALEAHFTVCASCRTARQMLTDFEELDTVDPQDGARIERLAALARSRVAGRALSASTPVRKVKLMRALALAAALALLVGSAFASARFWHAKPASKLASATGNGAAPTSLSVAPTLPLPSVPSAVSDPIASASPATRPANSASASSSPARAPDPVSAALLLRQAGDALRRGDRDPAALLYQKLQALYPGSAEALLSHVSLGRILAERGQPRAAVHEFDRYLAGSRGGVLIPEALYGRARALTGLGDRAEEARTWQRLLRDFPGSAYAEPARRRLAELE